MITPKHRLITIPISHYCEKARWALERAGVDFVEDAHLQIFHYLAATLAGGGRTVPVLTTPYGPLGESTEILRYADRWTQSKLFPSADDAEVSEWVQRFDEMGVQSRLWVYQHVLPHPKLAWRYGRAGVPRWQSAALPVVYPMMSFMLRRHLAVDAAQAQLALDACLRVFDAVADRLKAARFLVSDHFTAADLTFASLAAPLLMPRQYGVPLVPVDELPPNARVTVERMRPHPAGQYALRLFAEER